MEVKEIARDSGMGHVQGNHPTLEVLGADKAAGQEGFPQGQAFLVGVLGDGGGAVVVDVGVEGYHQH